MRAESLKALELFSGLHDDEIAAIAAVAVLERVPAGGVLFEEDALGTDLWIVESGMAKAEILLPGTNEPVVIAQIRDREIAGELALIDGNRRSATVRAAVDSVLLRLPRDRLFAALEAHPRAGVVVMHNLARIVARRLRDTNFALRTTLGQQRKILGALY